MTHIGCGILAVARVPWGEGRATRTGEVAAVVVETARALVAEVRTRRRPDGGRHVVGGGGVVGVVVGGSPRRRCRRRAGELAFVVELALLGAGSGSVGRIVGHSLWLLRCLSRHPIFSSSRCRGKMWLCWSALLAGMNAPFLLNVVSLPGSKWEANRACVVARKTK